MAAPARLFGEDVDERYEGDGDVDDAAEAPAPAAAATAEPRDLRKILMQTNAIFLQTKSATARMQTKAGGWDYFCRLKARIQTNPDLEAELRRGMVRVRT